MIFSLRIFLSVMLILSSFISFGTSIFCYDCNSAFDPRCGEEFDSFSLGVVNCSLRDPPAHIDPIESTFCRTIKMEIFGKVRVVRQCGFLADEPGQQPCSRHSGVGDVFVTHCSCDTDLCNTAFTSNPPEKALIFMILMFIFL